MRHTIIQNFSIQQIPIGIITVVDHRPMPAFEQRELGLISAAVDRVKARGPAVVRTHAGGVQLVAGRLQYESARALGAESLPCAVFEADVSWALAQLSEMFNSKRYNPIKVADLIATLVESDGFTQSQLAQLLGTQKSTICQLYKLTTLPGEAKTDRRNDKTVTQSELVRISRLPADQQSAEYWQAKKLASDRGKGSEDELKECCGLILRTASKMTRFQAKRSSTNKLLGVAEKAELLVAVRALSDALFSLKSFTETNRLKKILGSFLRNMV